MLLGDPQADVGAAGDDAWPRARASSTSASASTRGRGDEPAAAVADDERLLVVQRLQPRQGLAGDGLDRVGAAGSAGVGLLHRAHDRRVAGAAAEIARQRVVDRRLVRQRVGRPGSARTST